MARDETICFRLPGPERAELEAVAYAEGVKNLSAFVRGVTRDFVTFYLTEHDRDRVIEEFRAGKLREAEERVRKFEAMLADASNGKSDRS